MQTNIFNYVCFIVLCGLLVVDIVFFSSVALQIVCILLAVCVVGLVTFLAYKHHKGSYTSNEQQSNYQSIISENIALQKELNHYQTKQATTKQNSSELQTLVLINRRLTAQISNLQTHLVQLSEQLQTAKNSKQTAVVPITNTEQKQTVSNIKKTKTA